MIIKNNQSDNYKEKMQRCLKYVESLEEEHRKIQVFQRELPLCLELVSQGIYAYIYFIPVHFGYFFSLSR